jgi:hypothetical protein
MRATFLLGCMIAGGLASYFGQPAANDNPDIILIIITVFTVFAGFLIAIITIIGDPIMIPHGPWQVAELRRDVMISRLNWHVGLLICYLLTIGLLFAGVILEKVLDEQNLWRIWVERSYLFMGVTSFLFTFALPGALIKMQSARYDAEIERRRLEAGIAPSEPKK